MTRAKEFQNAIKDVEYKTSLVNQDITDLLDQARAVESLPEASRAGTVKTLLLQTIEAMENLDALSRLGNSKTEVSSLNLSKTFNKKLDSKALNSDIVEVSLCEENLVLKDQIQELDKKNREVKRMRVNAQKGIFDIEKKLNYVEEEVQEGEVPEVEHLEEIDLNQEATETNKKTNEILRGLKDRLEGNSTGEKYEQRLIRELSAK